LKCEGEAKATQKKIISVLFSRLPFPIWGAAVRSGRQAPLFVLAAGGGRPAEEGGAGELSCPSVVAS